MQEYYIHNLDCPDCAAKLENALNKLDYVKKAQIIFSTNKLLLETDDFEQVKSFIKKREPHLSLSFVEETKEKPLSFVPLISTIIVFLGALLVLHFEPQGLIEKSMYVLLGLVYLYAGKDVFLGAFYSFKKAHFFDENALMLIATIAAFCVGAYEESVSIMVFYSAGEFLQKLAIARSKKSIKALLDVAPHSACLKRGEELIVIAPEELKVGDVVVVKVGEKIPVDGTILKGETLLDQRALTGESMPINVKETSEVLGGSLNLKAVIEVEVKKTYQDSSIAKMVDLVQSAANERSETEKFITKFSRYYTPSVLFIAFLIATIPPLLNMGSFDEWIYRGLVALMVSCPCAFVISVPLGYFGGVGAASRKGILMKGVHVLEVLTQAKSIAFDKTGTLTKGVFKVVEISPKEGYSKEDVLRYASCSQLLSTHPIAVSINKACQELLKDNNTHKHCIEDYEEISGLGVKARCHADLIIAGNEKMLEKFNICHDYCPIDRGTVVYVSFNGVCVGHIVISDEIKEDALETLETLKMHGIEHFCILSGDRKSATQKIAQTLHCEYHASLLPEEKTMAFKEFKERYKTPAIFVGDGINDAPTLASADVGISMGHGSELSKQSADIIITNDSLSSLIKVLAIAKKTKSIIWQNILFALGVKAVFIVLGLMGFATLWEAVFGDVGVALLALANSMRALRA
ncbi:heavy metal translocating P-type ATPase [Helicobacter cetorum]|uniref:P-type Zn(2+) transporter n=1 Tax=Helicobacter cetorum (strain ATCC BAA-429 / MIT 00-7128) TaxID=182217 RepID=I0ENB2_HELC0|nr:heavy metal translocating P-type ATPase [Helicobacter cetorum]AFI04431.1 cadmium, zinc and cobalt-transporting ATPase [Helicobacter cetorum MIT 00-7128]